MRWLVIDDDCVPVAQGPIFEARILEVTRGALRGAGLGMV